MIGHTLPWFRWIKVSTTWVDQWIAGTAPPTRVDQPTILKIVGLAHMPLICKSTFAVETFLHLNQQRECPPIDSCILGLGQRTLKNEAGCSQMHDWKDSIIFLSTLQIVSDPATFLPKLPIFTNIEFQQIHHVSKQLSVYVKKINLFSPTFNLYW